MKNISRSENGPLKPLECRFDYPLPINDTGICLKERECILEFLGILLLSGIN